MKETDGKTDRHILLSFPCMDNFEKKLDAIYEKISICAERIQKENDEMLEQVSSKQIPAFSLPDYEAFFASRNRIQE